MSGPGRGHHRLLARLGVIAVAVVVFAAESPAWADDDALAAAHAALDKSDYLGARDALTRAVAAGDNDREAMIEIHRMQGVVAGALGETDAATTAFERMLALAPKAELPAGTSPKIAKPFAAARAYFKRHDPLKIDATTAAAPPAVTVTIVSDPLHMIERVRAIARVDGGRERIDEQPADASVTITLAAGARIDVRVVALDAHGNRLAEIGSAEVPLVIVGDTADGDQDHHGDTGTGPTSPRPPKPEPPYHPRSTIAKWWLWTGVAVVFAGTAGYFAYDARKQTDELDRLNADSSNHRFTEAQAVERRAKRDVLFANIGFGVAGAAAIAATILLVTEPSPPRERRTISLTPVPLADGGAAVVEVAF